MCNNTHSLYYSQEIIIRRYYGYERKLSSETTDAVQSIFRTFSNEFFGGALPDIEFRYILSKTGLEADYCNGLIRLALPLRLMAKNLMHELLFEDGLETKVAADIMHELAHHWQRPEKRAKRLFFDEYRRLSETGLTDEIEKREKESKEADIMHDTGFISKMREAGVIETYSGNNSRFTKFERIEKDSPLDLLLHTEDFMELCLTLKTDMIQVLDKEWQRRLAVLASRN